jgi:hypothetical protein
MSARPRQHPSLDKLVVPLTLLIIFRRADACPATVGAI